MEFDDVVVKENPGLCRCCLSEGCYKELGSEYIWMGENEVYADMLLECFDISISQHTEGPNGTNRLICEVCITRLRDACNFKKQVLECEKKFVDMIGRGDFKQKAITVDAELNFKAENTEGPAQTAEYDFSDPPMDFDNDETTEDITAEPLPVKCKRGRQKKATKTVTKPIKKVKEEKPKTSKSIKGPKSTDIARPAQLSSTKRNRLMKRNAISILEMSTAFPFKWHRHSYLCFFCHRPYKDFDQLKEHTRVDHEKSSIKSAVGFLKGDEKVKIDVSELACRVCNKHLHGTEDLVDHSKTVHGIVFNDDHGLGVVPYNIGRVYQCPVCQEKFEYFIKLNQHMNKHFSDYVCDLCGKSFLSQDRLRCHALSHGAAFHCSVCPQTFDSLTQRNNHEIAIHKKYKSIKCFFCPESFTNYTLRKKHHGLIHNLDVPRISCPICHKSFQILSKMRVHLKEVHLREKNYACTVCGHKFFSRTHVQKHMIKHSGERVHECSICKKTYMRKQTLRDHMRIHDENKYVEFSELRPHTKDHGECSTRTHSLKSIRGVSNVEIKIDVSEISCQLCHEVLQNINDLTHHLVIKHKVDYDRDIEMPFEEYRLKDLACLICEAKFSFFGYLVSHVNSNHPKNSFSCDTCQQKFNKKRDLFSHTKNYHREGGFVCESCDQTFTSLNILNKHKINRHITRCNICFLKLPSAVLKRKHMKTEHPDDGTLKCKLCFKQFHTDIGLKMHSRNCRSIDMVIDDNDVDVMDSDIKYDAPKRTSVKQLRENIAIVITMSTAVPFNFFQNKFNCFFCSKDFQDPDSLREHSILTHPTCDIKRSIRKCRESESCVKIDISSLSCKLCFESMNSLDALLDHLISKHDANYDKNIQTCLQPYRLIKDQMQCPLCPHEVFRFFGTLLKHMNTQHTDNKNICVHCGQSFRREQNLRVHLWRRHSVGKFNCTMCGIDCDIPSRLFMHMAKEHGVKAAKCPICPEAFQTQYLRQKHLIDAHNSGHKCSYCGKLFTRESFMKDHIRRTHLKEKNVECGICSAKFFNNILLKRHMVKHSGVKNFHCDVCGDRFYWKKSLSTHMAKHKRNDELPH
ncbi:unnamed protein product [Leptosia nina]|uniref:Uncharacterized protein n=1 Tax=Leptosia nina TaxID=320188 RepID=A0AAV1JNC4_9NEOP